MTEPVFTPLDEATLPPPEDVPPTINVDDSKSEPRKIKLGTNKKRGSGVRALTQADIEQLKSYYESLAFFMMLVNRDAATVCAEKAEECANAWADVAAQNDSVRKAILAMVEGGAWGKVIMAHIPIILPLIPPSMLDKIPGYAMMRQQSNGMPPAEDETIPV